MDMGEEMVRKRDSLGRSGIGKTALRHAFFIFADGRLLFSGRKRKIRTFKGELCT